MCLAHSKVIDGFAAQNELPAFAAGLIDTLNKGAVAMALSIGHRTGLFDAMRSAEAKSPADWARETGLNERYVTEWLGAMATAGIVSIDEAGRYALPAEHARFLGVDAPDGTMSGMMQWIGVLAPVETQIVDCFRKGGGVPYSAYSRFHDVMEEEGKLTFDADATLGLVPDLVAKLEAGIDVLDVGCGRGRALRILAERFPNSRFTGYDLSAEAIATARDKASGLGNIRFVVLDCMKMDDEDAFDLVFTFDAIHDQPHPAVLLRNIRRALRSDGVYIGQDIWAHTDTADNLQHPLAPFIYTISLMHCMTVSLAQGGIGLGAAWGEEKAREMLAEAGFGKVEMHRLEHDIQNAYYVCRT
ncbi:class I SAM-dependent methyltransferase [Aurantiacibacter poecillastricola]|uniref:class I SAM-dependent methyltransferase n=1 Tax=Aurantiacibacter poecillastricola TaxID=3064385 RepID=UPI00273F2392|nr:class I SAM-dependent methyltransferase [Aurantiacibacter sp. 219JJ12-13]MDP5260203.1 class I SAM-dependent methyltransferase [Aurantiacibacter sp. 219JJ12-13]